MLWGISWLNVQIMVADAAKYESAGENGEDGGENETGKIVRRELKSKEDIKNYIKGII